MKYNVYTVKDVKIGFMTPFFDVNDNSAQRGFGFALHQDGSVMGYAPKDYDLYRIGSFDTEKGSLEKEEYPVLVIEGVNAFDA